jgi:hypothetical protein
MAAAGGGRGVHVSREFSLWPKWREEKRGSPAIHLTTWKLGSRDEQEARRKEVNNGMKQKP